MYPSLLRTPKWTIAVIMYFSGLRQSLSLCQLQQVEVKNGMSARCNLRNRKPTNCCQWRRKLIRYISLQPGWLKGMRLDHLVSNNDYLLDVILYLTTLFDFIMDLSWPMQKSLNGGKFVNSPRQIPKQCDRRSSKYAFRNWSDVDNFRNVY